MPMLLLKLLILLFPMPVLLLKIPILLPKMLILLFPIPTPLLHVPILIVPMSTLLLQMSIIQWGGWPGTALRAQ